MSKAAAPERDEAGTQSLRRALQIVRLVSDHPGIELTEIAAALGVHKSTASRLCATLAQAGFLEPARPAQGRGTGFRLGLWLFVLGSRAAAALELKQQAPPVLRHLAQQSHLPVYLTMVWNGLSICIEEVPGAAGSVWPGSSVGVPHPLHATATGKLYLSRLDDDQVQAHLEAMPLRPLAPNTRTGVEAVLADLACVRARGYALNDEETEYGVRYLGVAVNDSRGDFLAGLTLGATAEQRTTQQLLESLPVLRAAAEALAIRVDAATPAPRLGISKAPGRWPRP